MSKFLPILALLLSIGCGSPIKVVPPNPPFRFPSASNAPTYLPVSALTPEALLAEKQEQSDIKEKFEAKDLREVVDLYVATINSRLRNADVGPSYYFVIWQPDGSIRQFATEPNPDKIAKALYDRYVEAGWANVSITAVRFRSDHEVWTPPRLLVTLTVPDQSLLSHPNYSPPNH
jgi:hypothetical protein